MLVDAESFTLQQAISAGFLVQVVAASEILDPTETMVLELSKLNMTAHAATKLRIREHVLPAIRSAIDRDFLGR